MDCLLASDTSLQALWVSITFIIFSSSLSPLLKPHGFSVSAHRKKCFVIASCLHFCCCFGGSTLLQWAVFRFSCVLQDLQTWNVEAAMTSTQGLHLDLAEGRMEGKSACKDKGQMIWWGKKDQPSGWRRHRHVVKNILVEEWDFEERRK